MVGSLGAGRADDWSDIDLLVVVDDAHLDDYAVPDRLPSGLGTLTAAFDARHNGPRGTRAVSGQHLVDGLPLCVDNDGTRWPLDDPPARQNLGQHSWIVPITMAMFQLTCHGSTARELTGCRGLNRVRHEEVLDRLLAWPRPREQSGMVRPMLEAFPATGTEPSTKGGEKSPGSVQRQP
ncbi:nucleotidyltransferase domain-containing protein [Nonomuraea polychroma]|uniref:nucleotidyltransferase domain-containing protein n=1 Tax=Nonomuraea polychroma TaxID=46176 RepID=UPI000FDCF30A